MVSPKDGCPWATRRRKNGNEETGLKQELIKNLRILYSSNQLFQRWSGACWRTAERIQPLRERFSAEFFAAAFVTNRPLEGFRDKSATDWNQLKAFYLILDQMGELPGLGGVGDSDGHEATSD